MKADCKLHGDVLVVMIGGGRNFQGFSVVISLLQGVLVITVPKIKESSKLVLEFLFHGHLTKDCIKCKEPKLPSNMALRSCTCARILIR